MLPKVKSVQEAQQELANMPFTNLDLYEYIWIAYWQHIAPPFQVFLPNSSMALLEDEEGEFWLEAMDSLPKPAPELLGLEDLPELISDTAPRSRAKKKLVVVE
ncbi:MAG: hypothetical protein OXR68_05510 [Alphaproteobacteria bacterium]|nr:hypothetical protein [Alphaproteobacteria bacterium]MDD9920061.1 hypothetical protein [Alphaproteobacteria bacterium]